MRTARFVTALMLLVLPLVCMADAPAVKQVRKDVFPAELGPIVRVGLSSSIGKRLSVTVMSQSECEIASSSGEVLLTVSGDHQITASSINSDVLISTEDGQKVTCKSPVRLVPAKHNAIFDILSPSAKTKRYRGILEMRGANGITVINELPLEEYVRGVVPFEVAGSFNPEAQKALVLAIRTYALRHLQNSRHASSGYDVCDSTDCQGFAGAFKNNAWVDKLVDGTRGQIITYKGKPIYACYSTDCGGATQNNEDAGFGSDPWPYLRGVADNASSQWPVVSGQSDGGDSSADAATPSSLTKEFDDYCGGCPSHVWSKTYTSDQLSAVFSGSGCGKFLSMGIVDADTSGRAKTVLVKGDQGETRISGNHLRDLLGTGTIKSTLMTITTTSDGYYVISGRGFGHGVGLCAWGANGFAKAHPDATYVDIVKRYYTGVEIQTLYGKSVVSSQPQPVESVRPSSTLIQKPRESGSLIQGSRIGAMGR